MSWDKVVVFGKPLKSVSVEYVGDTPLDGLAQKQALEDAYKRGVQEAETKFNAQLLDMRQQMQEHTAGILKSMQDAYDQMAAGVVSALPEVVVASVYQLVGPNTIEKEQLKAKVEHLIGESCPASEPVEVYLSKSQYEQLSEIYEAFTTSHPRLSFKVDNELNNGDCRMVSKFGEVDATLKAQLRRLMDELITT